jgi:hypothetical protein
VTGPGRPTLYKPGHARELCERGTNSDLADRFGVACSTHRPVDRRRAAGPRHRRCHRGRVAVLARHRLQPPRNGSTRCRRREHAPCRRLSWSAPLGETAKRPAERAQRAETPCKNPARRTRQRYQPSRRALRQPICAARLGGNRRKRAETPPKTLIGKLSAVSMCHFWGPPQTLIGVSLAETAETPEIEAAPPRLPNKTYAATPSALRIEV